MAMKGRRTPRRQQRGFSSLPRLLASLWLILCPYGQSGGTCPSLQTVPLAPICSGFEHRRTLVADDHGKRLGRGCPSGDVEDCSKKL